MNRLVALSICLIGGLASASVSAHAAEVENVPPEGFTALFNGQDLTGWWGLEHFDPSRLAAMSEEERAAKRAKNAEDVLKHWRVERGELINDGSGVYLTTERSFGDFELRIDYRTVAKADSGIYLKATPQVQIWDTTEAGGKWDRGSGRGSGGLWNNSAGAPGKDPLLLADKPFGEWNRLRILQVGARTTVYLNEQLVVDHAIMENYWDRSRPLRAEGPLQLQTHGGEIRWKNVFVREFSPEEANRWLAERGTEGFEPVFNGRDFTGWEGPLENYEIRDGAIACKPQQGGTIHTAATYGDFAVRLEFKLPPGGNNGLAIRYPGKGDTAYGGLCELQVLDSEHPKYATLDPRQYHGSAYGMVAAHRGYLRPTGEWNFQEVEVRGSRLRVELNGTVILDADLAQVQEFMGGRPHPGKDRTAGHFGFAGHADAVEYRNIAIRKLDGGSAP